MSCYSLRSTLGQPPSVNCQSGILHTLSHTLTHSHTPLITHSYSQSLLLSLILSYSPSQPPSVKCNLSLRHSTYTLIRSHTQSITHSYSLSHSHSNFMQNVNPALYTQSHSNTPSLIYSYPLSLLFSLTFTFIHTSSYSQTLNHVSFFSLITTLHTTSIILTSLARTIITINVQTDSLLQNISLNFGVT